MNIDERLVERYLGALNLGDVRYEPDGKVPPDFAIGGRVAVEVRRLNQSEARMKSVDSASSRHGRNSASGRPCSFSDDALSNSVRNSKLRAFLEFMRAANWSEPR